MDFNARLEIEIEQWRVEASQAGLLNRVLGERLEAAQEEVSSLQQENSLARETCRRNTSAANFFAPRFSPSILWMEIKHGLHIVRLAQAQALRDEHCRIGRRLQLGENGSGQRFVQMKMVYQRVDLILLSYW
jgi:hypothetical protein